MAIIATKPVNKTQVVRLGNGTSNGPGNRIADFINNEKTKLTINLIGNGGASALNLATFLNPIFSFADDKQEILEKVSEIWTKFATGSQGFITAIDQWNKQNIIPLAGNVLEVPIAIFSSGRNLWLFRGISQGLSQLFRVIDQREVFDKNGKPIIGENGQPKIIDGDFSDRGWWCGLTTTLKELPTILFELIQKPSKIKKFTHSLTLASTVQVTGGLLALCGLENIGPLLRNIAGIGVDFALMLDENKDNTRDNKNDFKLFGLNFSSWFTRAGAAWVGAAFADEAKRIPGVEDRISGLNSLSYFFDRGASILYTTGVIKAGNQNNSVKKRQRLIKAGQNPSVN